MISIKSCIKITNFHESNQIITVKVLFPLPNYVGSTLSITLRSNGIICSDNQPQIKCEKINLSH